MSFDTFSFMAYTLTSGTITNGTLTESFAGGFVSAEDINWEEDSGGDTVDTLENGEIFSDVQLADNHRFIGTFDTGLAAGRVFIFEDVNNGDFIVASFADLPLAFPDGDPGSFPTTIDTSLIDTSDVAFCFANGTGIATSKGERLVDDLKIGDEILTAEGETVLVKWVGVQQVPFPALMSDKMEPVLITAGALGEAMPSRDLIVSADHGMILDGIVVNASALVNGSTIRFANLTEPFTYYHVETHAHDVILANGAPSETFMDSSNRTSFDNHQEYLDLYGAERVIPEMDRPRISSARLLPEHIRARIGKDAPAEVTRLIA